MNNWPLFFNWYHWQFHCNYKYNIICMCMTLYRPCCFSIFGYNQLRLRNDICKWSYQLNTIKRADKVSAYIYSRKAWLSNFILSQWHVKNVIMSNSKSIQLFHLWKYNQLKGREQYDGQSGNACEKVCEKHVFKKTRQALSLSYFHIILLNKL